jgi:hypothetical protein
MSIKSICTNKINQGDAMFFIAISLLLVACGADTQNPEENAPLKIQGTQEKVFKHDKSIQCEEGGIPVDDMRLELAKAGVDVICAQKEHDGISRITVCGEATGNVNVFVIHNSNVPDAEKLGFKSVKDLPAYQDRTCLN